MQITRAEPNEAALLTSIAFAAKRHWGYLDDRAVGFYALALKGARLNLVHLWVLPDSTGRGIGRALFLHSIKRARELGGRELEVESDPNAEGFYQRLGAQRTGANIKLWQGHPRELPILVYNIPS